MNNRTHFFGVLVPNTIGVSAGRAAVENPVDIVDALHWYLSEIPGGAWHAKVEVAGADTAEPRMICKVAGRSMSWLIDPEDVPTATQVIADVIAEIRAFQDAPQ